MIDPCMCSKKGKSSGRKISELGMHIVQYAVFCFGYEYIKSVMYCYSQSFRLGLYPINCDGREGRKEGSPHFFSFLVKM